MVGYPPRDAQKNRDGYLFRFTAICKAEKKLIENNICWDFSATAFSITKGFYGVNALRRQREIGRMTPMIAFGDCKYCTFISIPGVIPFPEDKQRDYVYAAASRNETVPVMWISLEYNEKHELTKVASELCSFSDLSNEESVRLKAYGEEKAGDWLELYKLTHGKAPGRNDLCSCGSGMKYKFCCLNRQ